MNGEKTVECHVCGCDRVVDAQGVVESCWRCDDKSYDMYDWENAEDEHVESNH